MEPLKRIIELVKEANFKDANEICFDALYCKIEEKLNEKAETVREGCGCNNGNEELDPVNKKALKGKHKDRKDKDIDNDGDVDSSDKYLHKRRKAISKAMNEDDEKDFKPHMMYDPKTGKGYMAKTYQDHLRMDKMGYTHEKPEVKEAKSVPLVRTGQGSFTKDTHPKRKDGKIERMYQAKNKAEYLKLITGADTGRRGNAFSVQGSEKKMTVTVVFDNDKQRSAYEKKMKVEAYAENMMLAPKGKGREAAKKLYDKKDTSEAMMYAHKGTHYFKGGKPYEGPVHKMPNGEVHSGEKHTKDSKQVFHSKKDAMEAMKKEYKHEGAEMDMAKEKEKMAASQEKIRDLAIQLKKEKQRKRAEA